MIDAGSACGIMTFFRTKADSFQQDRASLTGYDQSMAATSPPGPKGSLLFGHLGELRRDALAFYTRCARDYGDVVALRFGWKRVYLLSHPDHIEQVLVTDSRNFTKHFGLRLNRMLLGEGLLTSEGEFWLRQRRLIQPAFLREAVAGYGSAMVELAQRLVADWHDGETRDVHSDLTRLTLEIAAKTMFGVDFHDAAGPVIAEALDDVSDTFRARFYRLIPLPDFVPTPANLRLRRAIGRLDAILFDLIAQRKHGDGKGTDLLSILMRARDEGDGRMTDRQVRDEAMTLFLAGHDTTALALSWGLYLLAQHPDVAAKLRSELCTVLGDRPATSADVSRLPFTDAVVHEIMRLYPPAYIIGRQAIAPFDVGGYQLPAGATVLMSQWVVQRDPRFYEEPERFYPERWLEGLARRLPKFAYFPFGGGPRVCVGNTFAMLEAVLVLATLARKYGFSVTPGPPVRPRPTITLHPASEVFLNLHRAAE
jgi:cytochrome P450